MTWCSVVKAIRGQTVAVIERAWEVMGSGESL